jgi:hypothetical protein
MLHVRLMVLLSSTNSSGMPSSSVSGSETIGCGGTLAICYPSISNIKSENEYLYIKNQIGLQKLSFTPFHVI